MSTPLIRIGFFLGFSFALMGSKGGCIGPLGYSYKQCNAGAVRPCFTGLAATKAVGICNEGTQTCSADLSWGPCLGEGKPSPEVCDGLDNDCNGKIDDLKPEDAPLCQRQEGLCKGSKKICGGTKGWLPCEDADYKAHDPAYAPLDGTGACDGKDNNCDGKIDEGCTCKPGDTQACGVSSQGECKKGSQTCGSNGSWGACLGDLGPSPEVCDGLDNDCDGKTDEGPLCKATETCEGAKGCTAGSQEQVLREGAFQKGSSHTIYGSAKLVKTAEGKERLDLSSDFSADSGPDLRVYLTTDPKGDPDAGPSLDLGSLTKTTGAQSYPLAASQTSASYKAVVIWCKPFRVNFGYATFAP